MDNENIDKQKILRLVFKILGITFLVLGIVFVISAFINFFTNVLSNDPKLPKLFWMFFLGFPLIGISLFFMSLGFRKDKYEHNENDTLTVIHQPFSPLNGDFFYSTDLAGNQIAKKKCDCGEFYNSDASFCNNCGKKVNQKCDNCFQINQIDAKYCDNCGKKL